MRQIERQMIAAIKSGKGMKASNTEVRHLVRKEGLTWEVRLHGHLIATGEPGRLSFTLAGWNTPTTRSRVNAVLREFTNGHSVYQHKHEPYFNNRIIGSKEWLNLVYVDYESAWRPQVSSPRDRDE